MPCMLTSRSKVSKAIIEALNVALDRKDITEATKVKGVRPGGMGIDATAARLLYFR